MPFANLFFLIGSFDLGLVIGYMFCRYTGQMPDLIVTIDYFAERIWLFCVDFMFKQMQNAVENRTRVALGRQTSINSNNSTLAFNSNSTNSTSNSYPIQSSSSSSSLYKKKQ